MPAHTEYSITTIDDLEVELRLTRSGGYAVDEQEQELGGSCFAVAGPDTPTGHPTNATVVLVKELLAELFRGFHYLTAQVRFPAFINARGQGGDAETASDLPGAAEYWSGETYGLGHTFTVSACVSGFSNPYKTVLDKVWAGFGSFVQGRYRTVQNLRDFRGGEESEHGVAGRPYGKRKTEADLNGDPD